MTAKQQNFSSSQVGIQGDAYVGIVGILGEIIAPMVTAMASMVLAGIDHLADWRSNRAARGGYSAPRPTLAPHVALMMVPSDFITQPFKKY